MAKEKEDVLQANAGAPTAEIPDLKKDKERKRAGAAWSGARAAAGQLSGAAGAASAGAAASSAGGAAGIAGLAAGKLALAAGVFLTMAGAGLVGYGRLKANGARSAAPDLGGIKDTLRVRDGGGDRLQVKSGGDDRFDAPAAKKPAAPPSVAKADAAKTAAPDAAQASADAQAAAAAQQTASVGQLAHDMSGSKLSSSLGGGGGGGGGFGSKDIFAGNGAAPKFGAGFSNFSKMGGKGKLSAASGGVRATASARTLTTQSSSRAFGQLKVARGMSQTGAGATTSEAASASALGAFDQQSIAGGQMTAPGAPPDTVPTVNPVGGGGGGGDGTVATPAGGVVNDAQVKSLLDQIATQAQNSHNDQVNATRELDWGYGLITLGLILIYILPAWFKLIGVAMVIAGGILVYEGNQLQNQSNQEATNAQNLAGDMKNLTGSANSGQSAAIDYCVAQAEQGTMGDSCSIPDNVLNENAIDQTGQQQVQQVQQLEQGN